MKGEVWNARSLAGVLMLYEYSSKPSILEITRITSHGAGYRVIKCIKVPNPGIVCVIYLSQDRHITNLIFLLLSKRLLGGIRLAA